jgi:hypothetical protein
MKIEKLISGTGASAKNGQTVTVHYTAGSRTAGSLTARWIVPSLLPLSLELGK